MSPFMEVVEAEIGSLRPMEAKIWSLRPKEAIEARIGSLRPKEAVEAGIGSLRPKEAVEVETKGGGGGCCQTEIWVEWAHLGLESDSFVRTLSCASKNSEYLNNAT